MWLTDSSGELFPAPTVMAVSGSREDGVNSSPTSWFLSPSCRTVPAVIRDIANIPQAAVLPTMADRGVDLSALPKEVRDQLAELDLELSEGKVSHSGFNSWSCGVKKCKRELTTNLVCVYMKSTTNSCSVSVLLQRIWARLQQMIHLNYFFFKSTLTSFSSCYFSINYHCCCYYTYICLLHTQTFWLFHESGMF